MAWQAIVKFAVQAAASYLISSLLTPSVRQTGSRLEDKSVQTSTYGASITRIHGTCAAHGNVIWLKGNQLFDISVTAKGKKTSIGGSRSRTTVFPVFATFAVGLCEGPIAGISRLWIGSDLVYDAGSDDIEAIIASNERVGADPLAELPQNIVFKGDVSSVQDQLPPWTFKIFNGAEDQEPSIAQEADKGAGNVPAYRGLAYIEIYNLPLEKYGNSLAGAQVKAEIIPAGTLSNSNVANPLVTVEATGFLGKPHYIDAEKTVFWRPNWDNTYPASSTVDRYDLYHNGVLVHMETRAITGISSAAGTGVPPNGDSDDPTEFWSGRARVFPGAGLPSFSTNTGYIQRRGDVYVGLGDLGPKVLYRNTRANVIVNGAGISKSGTAFTFLIDGANVYEFTPTGVNLLDSQLNTTATYAITFPASMTSKFPFVRAQKEGVNIYIFVNDDALVSGETETSIWQVDLDALTVTEIYADLMGRLNTTWVAGLKVGNFYVRSNTRSDSPNPGSNYYTDAFRLDNLTASTTYLSDVVSDEVQLSNYLTASDITVTSLTDEVRGYRITDTGSIRSSLEPLQAVWPFDVYQSGYKLKFVRRGNASVVSIPASKLDARPYGAAPGTELTIDREMDAQLPREVALKHLDAQREYDIGEQRAERKTTDSINKIELEIPVSMTATEAAQAVEVMLWMAWMDRHNVSFSLPPEYGNLEPTDVITVTGQWGTYTLRLADVDYKTDGRVVCTNAKFEAAATYTSTATGSESSVNEQTLGLSGPSFYQILDIPMIADEFDGLGTLAAMAGYTTGWPGGLLYRSSDNGATWNDVLGFQQPVTVGFASNAISTGRTDIRDFTNALECRFIGPVPTSISYADLLDWGNVFAYGAHGRWEIIGVQTVTAITGGYRLTDMLRGMFGTEWAMDDHEIGDRLVLLSTTAIQWLEFTAVDETKPFMGITSDRDLDTGTSEDFTYEGVNLTPLSPVYLNGNINPSTNDWTLTWLRRFRYSLQFADTIGTPADEDAISFEIDVFSDNTYATVLRTIAVTASTATYTSAQQVTDFGSNQSTLYLEVYAISATVGRGYALRTSITR